MDEKLAAGDAGTVVHVYRGDEAFEVEFVSLDGETVAIATLEKTQVRSVQPGEIAHARRVTNYGKSEANGRHAVYPRAANSGGYGCRHGRGRNDGSRDFPGLSRSPSGGRP